MRETFIVDVKIKSDEEIMLMKVTFAGNSVIIAEWEGTTSKPTVIAARGFKTISWNPVMDPVERLQTLYRTFDRQFQTT